MPGLIRGVARTAAIAGTATVVSNRVSRRQAGRWADQEQQQAQQAPPPEQYQQAPPPQYQQPAYQEAPPPVQVVAVVQPSAPPSEEPDMSSKLAQLQQLGELKAQGILTDAEFEAQKQKILTS
jgi:Short C-terminal domain